MTTKKHPPSRRSTAYTPWGSAQHETVYADGIVCYNTASHGGFKVRDDLNAQIPPLLRLKDGWYEEDCDWAIVAVSFPNAFHPRLLRHAVRTMQQWHATAYYRVREGKRYGSTELDESPLRQAAIRRLNDRLRKNNRDGKIVKTIGFNGLDDDAQAEALRQMRAERFEDEGNDPNREHEFGVMDVVSEGEAVKAYWKIDYYEKTYGPERYTHGSDAPWDPQKTDRVLTLLLAEEW